MPSLRALSLLGLLSLAAACAGPGDAAEPPGAKGTARLTVRSVRMILLPSTGAVYLTVVNPGAADRLVRVETPAARRAELHESVLEKDMMRMVAHPDGFAVPAGGTLELKPGGKHLMLVDLQGHPGTGEKVPLTLHFACAGAITVAAEVSPP